MNGVARRLILRGATQTVFTLFGGLALGLLAGTLTFELIPGSSVTDVQLGHAAIAAIPAIAGLFAGGAAWGARIGRLAGVDDVRRMARAGMLGFGPIAFALAFGLGMAEPALVGAFAERGQPIHRAFTVLFTPSAALIGGVSAWTLAHALGMPAAWKLGLKVALAAGIAFLVVNLSMEAAGWVVGAPGAAARATMLVVTFLGMIAAALIGGAVVGHAVGAAQNRAK